MRPLPIAPLGGAADFIAGAAVVRGVPTPVLDTRVLLGMRAAGPAGRFVTVRSGARTVALAVDAVEGVRDLPEGLARSTALLSGVAAEAVEALGTLDAELLIVLRGGLVFPDELWAAAGRATGERGS